MSCKEVKVLAPAKINLTLDILGKRVDGYHDVAMVLQSISLYDEVKVKIDEELDTDEIEVTCTDKDIPTNESNIVCKITRAFYKATSTNPKKVYIDIDKKIPSQAGLAGGSTDGAATLLALNFLYGTHLKIEEMAEIASKVGSDIPFCLYGGTMLATETGTKLQKLAHIPKCFVVVIKPDVSVSTKEAYDKCDSKPYKEFKYTDEVIKQLYRRDIRSLSCALYNEFEQVLELPDIIDVKKNLMKNKAEGCSMSGSGSAVYGIFLNEKKANKCVEKLKEKYDKVFLCEPLKDGCKIL